MDGIIIFPVDMLLAAVPKLNECAAIDNIIRTAVMRGRYEEIYYAHYNKSFSFYCHY